MVAKRIELEVDFIGGEGALTAAEEQALSDFFKQRKKAKNDTQSRITNKKRMPIQQVVKASA